MPGSRKQNDGVREQPPRQTAKKSAGMYCEDSTQDDVLNIMNSDNLGALSSGNTDDHGQEVCAKGVSVTESHGGLDMTDVSVHLARLRHESSGPTLASAEHEGMYNRIMNDLNNILETKLEEKLDSIIDRKFRALKTDLTKDLEQVLSEKLDLRIQNIKKEIQDEVRNDVGKEIEDVKNELKLLRKENDDMQKRFARSEGQRLATKIILSGSSIPRATEGEQIDNIARKVISDNLNISAEAHIVQAQRFGSRPTENGQMDKRPILIEVKNIESKRTLVNEALKKKPRDFYISELLPQNTNNIFFSLRKIKRETRKIQVLYTKDGVIKVRKTREGKLFEILTESDLNVFLKQAGIEYEM